MNTTFLIRQVRSQLQETNEHPVSDTSILDALNRGKDYAVDIMSRYYFDPLIKPSEVVYPDSDGYLDIPEDAFEDRIKVVEYKRQGTNRFCKLRRLNVTEISGLENAVNSYTPVGFQIIGSKVRIYPINSASNGVRLWYMVDPETLVKVQGQISQIEPATESAAAYIVVDAVGSDIDAANAYNKYINFCDAQTGIIKGTAEVQSVSGQKITLKSIPSRAVVLNRTILSNTPDNLESDDYICLIEGACVLPLKKPISNFIVQFAVAEIRRSLGYDVQVEEMALRRFEKQVNDNWSNREETGRIQQVNPIWKRNLRRS